MIIDEELKGLIPPLEEDEYKQLEANLIKEGWRANEKIIVWNDIIVDGHNRFAICQKHNIQFQIQEKQFNDKNDVILWMIDNQLGRRNLPDYARGELTWKKLEILKPKAEANMKKGLPLGPNDTKVDMKKEVAKASHIGDKTASKIKFIRDHADENTKNKLRSGNKELSINKVYMDLRRKLQREEAIIKANNPPALTASKKYSVILADPPWRYFETGNHNQSFHYKTLTIDEIKALPVKDLAADDCILFLWVTFPILEDSFKIIEAWGFKYSTCGFNWIKRNKSGQGWFFGLGQWTRSNSELCLIARKGNPIRQSANVSQIIDEPLTEHSHKPGIVRDKIVELMGDIPRIELFATEKVSGWDAWGNDVK